MNKKHFFLGFVIGGVTLTACTLLGAPASGKETRQAMKDQTKGWLKNLTEVKENLQDLIESIKTASLESTENIKSFVADLKIAVTDWKREIEPHQQEIKKELEAIELSIQTLESQINKEKQSRSEDSTE